jgi:hypothetical protein
VEPRAHQSIAPAVAEARSVDLMLHRRGGASQLRAPSTESVSHPDFTQEVALNESQKRSKVDDVRSANLRGFVCGASALALI